MECKAQEKVKVLNIADATTCKVLTTCSCPADAGAHAPLVLVLVLVPCLYLY